MIAVHVHCRVVPGGRDAFREATLANARASVQEPGVLRFDVLEDAADPDRFVLVEVYRDADAPVAHKATAHYATWRDAVAELMAEPRSSARYTPAFPVSDAAWACDATEG